MHPRIKKKGGWQIKIIKTFNFKQKKDNHEMVVTQFPNISGSTMGISVTIEAWKKVGREIVPKQ